MQIEYIKLDELNPYDNNPRNNDDAVAPVAESIKEFGFKVPIIVDADGVIIAGHTRYKAAQSLGMGEVPCIVADDLTDEQVKAFRLADNKTGELADWDLDKMFKELDGLTLDMELFGFSGELDLDVAVEDFGESDEKDSEFFQMSLVFPIESKEAVDALVAKDGKEALVEMILKRAGEACA